MDKSASSRAPALPTPAEVIMKPQSALLALGCTPEQVQLIKREAARKLFKGFLDLDHQLALETEVRKISFGCSALDQLTDHGLRPEGITELYGEPGSGKTQIVLQLAVSTVKMGLSCAVVSTERRFPIRRLVEMVNEIPGGSDSTTDLLDLIWIAEERECEGVQRLLERDLELLLKHRQVGILIVDSVAGLFRKFSDDLIKRAQVLRRFNACLKALQEQYGFAILCTNQVMSCFDQTCQSKPCLGPIWMEFLTNRFRVSKLSRFAPRSNQPPSRRLEVDFSPFYPSKSHADFLVTPSGLANLQE